jgi:hypothetical protein
VAGVGVLEFSLPVPTDDADVKLAIEDAGANDPVAPDRGVVPALAGGARDAVSRAMRRLMMRANVRATSLTLRTASESGPFASPLSLAATGYCLYSGGSAGTMLSPLSAGVFIVIDGAPPGGVSDPAIDLGFMPAGVVVNAAREKMVRRANRS